MLFIGHLDCDVMLILCIEIVECCSLKLKLECTVQCL